jgi:23S rRNA (cytosine1962-C5)-methyltransferase
MKYINLITQSTADYELLDSGEGVKLERYGQYVLSRPDPGALWKKNLPPKIWADADGQFIRQGEKGKWQQKKDLPASWSIVFGRLKLLIKPSSFKHTGLFPEQEPNWTWMSELISGSVPLNSGGPTPELKVLNLFAYTGGATLACAKAGAEVVHLDASKKAIDWARENAELSGLADKPIRWILDDAMVFLKREVKRGNKYDGIIMDPPSFGRGPKDELWKIEEDFIKLFDLCLALLSDKPLFFLINGYASGYSPIAYGNNLELLVKKYGGSIELGELAIQESKSERLLPAGIFARWQA